MLCSIFSQPFLQHLEIFVAVIIDNLEKSVEKTSNLKAKSLKLGHVIKIKYNEIFNCYLLLGYLH